ncbi:putative cytoplasmic protein [Klebsiella pneumoniae]|uniref:Putative cytoplasmic protein n=1 Tax=Klebsiella pneumoniae TaxID=573 RepID=A0A4P0XKE8_KLEPN|nr:putative cytoplasmic protein [Klebsiella pneumoniae]
MATVWVKAKKSPQALKKRAHVLWSSLGVAADMKLGDIMKAENATFGISFCGSGGAGAITAQTKYGYKAKYGMRSIDEGVTAINEGCNVLGFGFMDKEELGERLVEAWKKKYGA